VVDLWGGYADFAKGKIWQQDTLTVGFSTTKVLSFLKELKNDISCIVTSVGSYGHLSGSVGRSWLGQLR